MADKKIIPGTDMRVTLTGLQNPDDDSYFNAATVTFTAEDISGTEVVSSQTVTYESASNGNYLVTVDKDVFSASMVIGRRYNLFYTAVEGGVDRKWKLSAVYEY